MFFRRHEPHEHVWTTVNVQHSAPAIFTGGIPSTIVLQMCECSRPQTLTIQGKWELADLTRAYDALNRVTEQVTQT